MDDYKLIADYFKKCFFSVDGLWFLKTEEDSSFNKALELDTAVWEVLPKIEARTIKKLLGLADGIDCLRQALDFKLKAEDYAYRIVPGDNDGFTVEVHGCPWVHHITKAGRKHLLQQIADAICHVEYGNFARQFGDDIAFAHEQKGCTGERHCIFRFALNG